MGRGSDSPFRRRSAAVQLVTGFSLIGCALAGCTGGPSGAADTTGAGTGTATVSVRSTSEPVDVVTNLEAPWSMADAGGTVLVSERDSGLIKEVGDGGTTRTVGKVDGVVPGGEGGLLGIAVGPKPSTGGSSYLYAYFTSVHDNRIVRMPLDGGRGSFSLGKPDVILSGIAKASIHNGGRIAFGPDGKLYATAGDAGIRNAAQDPTALNGKILRLEPDGTVPADNPFPGSPVFTLGHRNPQGIGWDGSGRMWASEFGQNRWDELNLIQAGHNYGWPEVEGIGGNPRFSDPVLQWPTSEASPSGIAVVGGTIYMSALRGQRLWVIRPAADGRTAAVSSLFDGRFGRLRDVRDAGDGSLWLLTNNTDGRGSPRPGDDRIVSVRVTAG